VINNMNYNVPEQDVINQPIEPDIQNDDNVVNGNNQPGDLIGNAIAVDPIQAVYPLIPNHLPFGVGNDDQLLPVFIGEFGGNDVGPGPIINVGGNVPDIVNDIINNNNNPGVPDIIDQMINDNNQEVLVNPRAPVDNLLDIEYRYIYFKGTKGFQYFMWLFYAFVTSAFLNIAFGLYISSFHECAFKRFLRNIELVSYRTAFFTYFFVLMIIISKIVIKLVRKIVIHGFIYAPHDVHRTNSYFDSESWWSYQNDFSYDNVLGHIYARRVRVPVYINLSTLFSMKAAVTSRDIEKSISGQMHYHLVGRYDFDRKILTNTTIHCLNTVLHDQMVRSTADIGSSGLPTISM
jgi:hypothetical protein